MKMDVKTAATVAFIIGLLIGAAAGYLAAPKGISPAQYQALLEQRDKLQAQVSDLQGQVQSLQGQVKSLQAKLEKLQQELSGRQQYTVLIAYKEGIGYYLTDAKGRTLYYFAKDVPGSGKSACYGDCAKKWPPFYVENLVLPPGLSREDFSVITRSDGKKQLAYKGWPLYYFFKDAKPGDTNGEDVKHVWFVMKPDYTVMIAYKEGVGTYLVDSKGMTLYWFKKDSPGKSVCEGECLAKWPPFYVEEVVAPSPIQGDFGVIQAHGGKQVTFRGYPLYYFFMDKAPGDTKGQGVKGVWYVVDPFNFPPAMGSGGY